jgi:hypothetical protein
MQHQLLKQLLSALDNDNNSTLYELVLQTLRSRDPTHQRHQASLLSRIPDVLDALSEQSSEVLAAGAMRVAAATYQFELRTLIHPQNGFHFAGTSASLGQLEDFSIARMGRKIQEVTPNLWRLLGDLLNADPSRMRHAPMGGDMNFEMEVDVEPSNIAAAVFGNDKGSDNDSADNEGSDKESDVGMVGESADVEDGGLANSSGEDVTEGEAATGTDSNQKHCYRKQNAVRRNAVLLFIVSAKLTCETTTTYQSNRGELLL